MQRHVLHCEPPIVECMHPSDPEAWEPVTKEQAADVLEGFCPFVKYHEQYPVGHERRDRRLLRSEQEGQSYCRLDVYYRIRQREESA